MKLWWTALAAAGMALCQAQPGWEELRAGGRRAFEQGRYREAEPLLNQALIAAQREEAAGQRTLHSLRDLAGLHRALGRHNQAEELLRAVLAIREAEAGAESPGVLPDVDALAWAVFSQGRISDAADLFRRSLSLVEREGKGGLPLIGALFNLARMVQPLQRDAETVALLERILAEREKLRGAGHPETAGDMMRLGRHHGAQKRPEEAIRHFERALAVLEAAHGAMHISVAAPLDELGAVHASQKRFEQAEPLLRRSVTVREWAHGPLAVELAPALENLAAVWLELKRLPEAEEAYRSALALWELRFGPAYPLIPPLLDRLGSVCAAQHKYDKSEVYFMRALELRQHDVAANLNNVALVASALEKHADAEPHYKAALALLDKPAPKVEPALLQGTLENYRDLLTTMKRRVEAARLAARLKAMQAKQDSAPQQVAR